MDISLDLLRTFKLVAYYNSVSKAAEKLCVTQSSVSKAIKKLEDDLKLTLFIREKKGMKLTESGKILYHHIYDSISTLEKTYDVLQGINELDNGSLHIGASLSAIKHLLIDAVTDFKKLYPHVEIIINNTSSAELYTRLKNEKLDLIFINSTVKVNQMYATKEILEIEDCFFVSKEYYEKIKNVDNLEEYILKNVIVQNIGYDTRKFFVEKCLKRNISFKPILQVDRNSTLVNFVLKGLGVGFATKVFIQDYIDSGEVVVLDTNFKLDKRKLIAVYKNAKNKKIEKFLELVDYYKNKSTDQV